MEAKLIERIPPLVSPYLLSTVRGWLTSANLGPSRKLPPERDLAAQFCVSRAEIRKALSVLEGDGLINRHVGRGTFLAPDLSEHPPTEDDIVARTSPLAAMQARLIIEPELAGLAALSATPAQVAELRELCRNMRKAASWEDYARLDWQFHNKLAEATGNVLLIEFQRLLNGVRRYVVWGNLQKEDAGPKSDYHSFEEHEAIVEAIEARNPRTAILAMRKHLGVTRSQMIDSTFDLDQLEAG
ncbi:DNA-binding transcriptional regulator, FadR family [Caulobacter sp. UNC279MFTsu5.1]|nr:DNA-binding transcriptional regulator, FadR family [Caulobacter sp. UNC279MFTsu5.1]